MTSAKKKFLMAAPEEAVVPCVISDPSDVFSTFMELVSQTCPGGHEDERFGLLLTGYGFTRDIAGNYYRLQGESGTMFTAHLDDVSYSPETTRVHTGADHLTRTDGKTILGADCKAGMSVMLHMLAAGTPGLYVFFCGEESGRIGSEDAVRMGTLPLEGIVRCVSFDRKGYDSVISQQMGEECCSPEFADALADQLNIQDVSTAVWAPDPTGSYTDSYSFVGQIQECTNVSVGCHDSHMRSESTDLAFLGRLAHACTQIDWEALPTIRVAYKRPAFVYSDWPAMRGGSPSRYDGASLFDDEPGLQDVMTDYALTGHLNHSALLDLCFNDPDSLVGLLAHLIDHAPDVALDYCEL